jgi:hypothetical protein
MAATETSRTNGSSKTDNTGDGVSGQLLFEETDFIEFTLHLGKSRNVFTLYVGGVVIGLFFIILIVTCLRRRNFVSESYGCIFVSKLTN